MRSLIAGVAIVPVERDVVLRSDIVIQDKMDLSGPELYPGKVTLVKERVLLGPRGGGPPPGDGFESAPIKEICDAVARELAAKEKKRP